MTEPSAFLSPIVFMIAVILGLAILVFLIRILKNIFKAICYFGMGLMLIGLSVFMMSHYVLPRCSAALPFCANALSFLEKWLPFLTA